MRYLRKMPQDAIVTVNNDSYFVNGEYEVTSVETYDCKTVTICTDYENRLGE